MVKFKHVKKQHYQYWEMWLDDRSYWVSYVPSINHWILQKMHYKWDIKKHMGFLVGK